jgi:SecD/SecF fusion protein
LLDKIIAQGGGPVLGLFSKRYSNSKRLFKRQDVRNLLSADPALCEIPLGKLTIIKDAKDKDVEAVELRFKGNRDNTCDGGVVTDAKIHLISQENLVSMQMNGQSKGWEELTGRAYTQKSNSYRS